MALQCDEQPKKKRVHVGRWNPSGITAFPFKRSFNNNLLKYSRISDAPFLLYCASLPYARAPGRVSIILEGVAELPLRREYLHLFAH